MLPTSNRDHGNWKEEMIFQMIKNWKAVLTEAVKQNEEVLKTEFWNNAYGAGFGNSKRAKSG